MYRGRGRLLNHIVFTTKERHNIRLVMSNWKKLIGLHRKRVGEVVTLERSRVACKIKGFLKNYSYQ